MKTILEGVYGLKRWCEARGIDPSQLTIIVNTRDPRTAAQLDAAIHDEFRNFYYVTDAAKNRALQKGATIMGVKFVLESPIHAEPTR